MSLFTKTRIKAESLQGTGPAFDVVMLATVHPATDVRIFHREAKTLAAAGLSVCILGPHPSAERLEGVWIEALPRAANRLQRLFLGWSVLRRARQLQAKLYIFHDPELFWVGVTLRLFGKKVVYDCHENLPMQVLQKAWIPWPARWAVVPVVWLIEWTGSRLLSGVVVAREAMMERFPRRKRVLVRNFPPEQMCRATGEGSPVHLRRNVVIYAGGLSRLRGIGELVRAFRHPDLAEGELWLVGDFSEQAFRDEILQSLPPNVRWLGRKDYPEVIELYKLAKLGAVLLHPTASHKDSLPLKLFEYLAAGLPVIASNFPEWVELLNGCGVQVNPFDVDQIRVAIRGLLSDAARIKAMSAVARDRVLNSYCWENEGRRLVQSCCELIRCTR
jgi:glycosyltransferase involved in cell wall biosynthesis